jgi:hypothetical protein
LSFNRKFSKFFLVDHFDYFTINIVISKIKLELYIFKT